MLEKSVAKAMLGENLEIGSKLSPEPLETITEVKFEHVVSPYIGYMFNVPAEPVCSLWFCGSNYLQRGAFQATGPGYRYTYPGNPQPQF